MGHTTEEGMITIKVAHCGQTKRTTFKKTELTYESLTDWIVSAFGLQAPLNASPARLAYRDPEGDVISIDSSDELSEALRLTPENAILSLHLSFPRPRGERWFARMCAEHAMADEATAALSPQAPASRFSTGAADATAASSQGDAAGDSSSAAPLDETAAASAASAQDKAPELGWCERRRAWKAAWKARMAEARASGAFPPGASGFAFDGPQHHGPHHGPHPHPHHHHGRHGMMGPGPHHGPHHRGGMMGFGGGMGPRPEFCGRPDFHHGPAGRPEFGRPESPSSGASAPENDFGRPEFGRFHHHHPHHHRAADDEHRPHFPHHPFHHHAPHPHPWTGFGAMPPAYWMMPPCGMPMMPFAHPWAGFSVPAAFAPTASASEPTSPPFHPHAHHHAACAAPAAAAAAPAHDEGHFGGMRRPGFNREECALKRQLNWLLVLTILVVAFHFVPIGVVAVPILGAAAGAVAFCLRRKLRKLKHARGHWAAHHMMSTSSSPSSSPAPAAAAPPTAAPSAPVAAEALPEAPMRRCHGGRFHHHGRDFAAPFVAPVPAPAAEPVAAPAPVVVAPAEPFHARRCRIQVAPAAPAPVTAVSIVPPVAEVPEAAASPEPLVGHDFRQFRKDLQLLQSMGFTDMHMNRKLLHRLGDVNRVVAFLTDTAQ